MATDLRGAYDTIATAFDLGRVLQIADRPVRGLQGQVWRLRTTSGIWAVKESFVEITEDVTRGSDEFQEAARRGGVPAPAVRVTADGHHVTEVDGVTIRVHSWVEIAGPDPMLAPAEVGAMLARLHRVVLPPDGPPHWWYTAPVGAATWDALVDQSQAVRAPFADGLAALRDDLVALEMIMTPMDPVQRCHLDLWADNVRRAADGGLCVIDWDNSGPADPSRELALLVYEFARTDPRRMAELYRAYQEHGGPGRLRTPSDFSMLAAQLGHIGSMHLRRWLDPAATGPERARALAGVQEFVADPLTPTVVSSILDAVD